MVKESSSVRKEQQKGKEMGKYSRLIFLNLTRCVWQLKEKL